MMMLCFSHELFLCEKMNGSHHTNNKDCSTNKTKKIYCSNEEANEISLKRWVIISN